MLWRDLDANRHANNVSYIEWALETIPPEVRRQQKLAHLDVEFRGEALLGQEIVCGAERESSSESMFYRASVKTLQGKELAVLRIGWSEC